MAKITLPSIGSGYASVEKLNEALQQIEDELNNKVLYRKNPIGEPNDFTSDVDLNGNDLLNVSAVHAETLIVAGEDFTVPLASLVTQDSVASLVSFLESEISKKRVTQNTLCKTISYSGGYAATITGPLGGNEYIIAKAVDDVSRPSEDAGSIIHLSTAEGGWYLIGCFPDGPSVEQWGAKGDGLVECAAIINTAITFAQPVFGYLKLGKGNFKVSEKISCNQSNFKFIGSGSDVTILRATGTYKTCLESNNGSWDEETNTYTLSGSSLGSVVIEGMTLNGYASTGCTGLALARFTLGCLTRDVKITGFAHGARLYGSWYSNHYNLILENNSVNSYIDYETNDVSFFGCDWISNPANQSLAHIQGNGNGTCRNVNFYGCGFDGLPIDYGIRVKNFNNMNFFGGYMEVYNDEVTKTANFIELGQGVVGVVIDGTNLITGTGYSGTWLKCAMSATEFARNVDFRANFQYNGDTNTCKVVDTTDAKYVALGNSRVERPIVIGNVDEVLPNKESQIYIPKTTGLEEVSIPIATIRNGYSIPITVIKLTAVSSGATTATQYFRIRDKATPANVYVNFPMPTIINAGDEFFLTDDSFGGYVTTTGRPAIQSQLAEGTVLEAYTYKVGASQDWPDFNISVEQL